MLKEFCLEDDNINSQLVHYSLPSYEWLDD